MLNLSEVYALLENLSNGKGAFYGAPVFLQSDGSLVNEDGILVAKASEMGKSYYDNFAGFVSAGQLPTGTVRGGIIADAKGSGDTIPCKIGTDGKLYVPTYPADAQYDMTALMVVVDEVAAALPGLPVAHDDGYRLADQTTEKIYTLATVAEEQTWGSGVALAAGKLYTDGTDVYVFGSGSLAKI